MQQQNQLTKVDNEAGNFLQKFGKSLEQYAIRKYSKDIFLKSAVLAIVSNPDLTECLKTEQGKLSLFSALRYAATTGLSLNPQEGCAALITYSGRIQYQIMKNGLIELALESGKIENLMADHVRINDQFKLTKTSDGDKFEFQPALEDRGSICGFFAAIKFKNGSTYMKWMTKSEIEEIRDKYSKFVYDKNGNLIKDAPWNKSFIGMGEKTVIRKLLKSISISNELNQILSSEDFYEAEYTIEPGINAEETNKKLEEKSKSEEKKSEIKSNNDEGSLL